MKKSISLVVMILAIGGQAYADGFSMSAGMDYSSGKYGSSDKTNVWYMPLTGTYVSGAFTYKLVVPYIRVTGPGDIVPSGIGGSSSGSSGATSTVVCTTTNSGKGKNNTVCNTVTTSTTATPGSTTTRKTESGLGDIVASATYNLLDTGGTEATIIDVTGRIKFGTADENKALGSGENDYAVQAYVEKNFGAPYIGAGLGYKWLGEPAGLTYKNIVYGSIEGGYKPNEKMTIGLAYDWATASISGGAKPQDIALFASYRINERYKLSGVLYSGLSNASPDVGGGITLGYYF